MRIFITGATGFLGSATTRRLVHAGHEVWALARSTQGEDFIRSIGATPVRGALPDVSDFATLLKNMEVVIHCAAPVVFWGPWSIFNEGIVQATNNLAQQSSRAGVRRFIYVSSEAVLQDARSLDGVDEKLPPAQRPNSLYGRAKKLAEQDLISQSSLDPQGMELIILRPTFIWGPGASAIDVLADAAQKGVFRWPRGGQHAFEAIHVDNVAYAIEQALIEGKNGGIYLITDAEKESLREFVGKLLTAAGAPVPQGNIPFQLLKFAGLISELTWNLLHLPGKPPLTRFDAAFIAQPRRYITAAAQAVLRYQPPKGRAAGLEELAQWYRGRRI